MYKRLSSKTLLVHPRITVVEDQVELPGGQTGDYIWIDKWLGAVTVIPRNENGEILVEREYSYLPNTGLLQFPGGRIEPGEEPLIAANREMTEEVGLYANRLMPLGSFLIDHRRTAALMHVFIGEELESRASTTHDVYEAGFEKHWLTEDEIDTLIVAGEVSNAVMLACWAIYKVKLRQPGGLPKP